MRCSAADTHLKLLDCAVSGARLLTGGVFESSSMCQYWVLLYETRCNPMHPLYGALPWPYLPVWVTRGALVAHRYTYSIPRCRTAHYSVGPLSPLCVPEKQSCWPCIRWCGTARFQDQGQCFFIGLGCSIPFSLIQMSRFPIPWVASYARWWLRMLKVARSIPGRSYTDLYYVRGDQEVLPTRLGGVTIELDQPSLTPLFVAGCGRLKL